MPTLGEGSEMFKKDVPDEEAMCKLNQVYELWLPIGGPWLHEAEESSSLTANVAATMSGNAMVAST